MTQKTEKTARRDEVLTRLLKTPPTPHNQKSKKTAQNEAEGHIESVKSDPKPDGSKP